MLSRRIATFLVGAWLGCGLLVGVIVLQNLRWAGSLLGDSTDAAKVLFAKIGEEDVRFLLNYSASEQSRAFLNGWEVSQIVLGLVLIATLALAPQRRIFPITLVVLMILVTLVQHFNLTPEIVFQGRQGDFLPPEAAFSTRSRLTSFARIYAGTEISKLLLGGLLASYLFVTNASKKMKRRRRESEESAV